MIATVPLRRVLEDRSLRMGRRELAVVGSGFGILAGTTVGAGMVLGPFMLGAGVVGEHLVALVAALGLGLNITKTVVFGISPLLDVTLARKGLLIGLCTMPGAFTGRWIVTNTPIRIHTLFMEGFILCGAIYFLWKAGQGHF